MPGWGFWGWLSYICIGIAAVVLAVDQAAKGSTPMRDALGSVLSSPLWNYAPAVLIAISGVVIILGQLGIVGADKNSQSPADAPLEYRPTSLRLQFFGDYRIPHQVSLENVVNWFAYYSPSMKMEFRDDNDRPLPGGLEAQPTWAIFVAIDKPTSYGQVIAAFSNPEVAPPMEVRMSTSRTIVLTSKAQFPAGVLEIKVVE